MSDDHRRPSRPTLSQGVRSAARTEPLEDDSPHAPLQARLKAGAEDQALNLLAILREAYADFQAKDRFFKYKALIIALWFLLSGTGVAVAWPDGMRGLNEDLGARLVVEYPGDRPVFIVTNESKKTWQDVTLVVNGQWVGSAPVVDPQAQFTMTPRQLTGRNGTLAPADLRAQEIELKTRHGKALLMKDGQLQ